MPTRTIGEDTVQHVSSYRLETPTGDPVETKKIKTAGFDGLGDECPACDGTEFTSIVSEYEHVGGSPPIVRTDYGRRQLFIGCKSCHTVLLQEPQVPLFYDVSTYVEETPYLSE